MDIYAYIGIGFAIFTAIINVGILIAIKFNDLYHVQKSLNDIKKKFDDLDKKVDNIAERVSTIEGKLDKR